MKKMKFFFVLIVCASIIASGVIKLNKYIVSSRLCNAIKDGDSKNAFRMIERIDDINHYTAPTILRGLYAAIGETIQLPLVEACAKGEYDVVKTLLEKNADPNMYYEGYFSSIEASSINHNLQRLSIYQILIENGAEIDLNGSGNTALFNELKYLYYSKKFLSLEQEIVCKESIAYLLQNGAKSIDNKGNTVVHYLCIANQNEYLAKLSSEYELPIDLANKKGQTPIMWAIEKESVEAVDYLISKGADLNAVDLNGKSVLDYANETKNEKLISLIMVAIENART